ncbi:MAG: Gfo/Idh/MocA family oxidoreductase, partial [Muribaculaceae bacterium]|nr:Gfo/Idh/MocA family oxidoreductase [Muribaculaceae bacterium]
MISDPNASRKPVSIVMIGAGNRARKYLEYIIATPSHARVVGVVEPNALRRNAMADHCNLPAEARYDSVESFFNAGKIADGVIIATPDVYH